MKYEYEYQVNDNAKVQGERDLEEYIAGLLLGCCIVGILILSMAVMGLAGFLMAYWNPSALVVYPVLLSLAFVISIITAHGIMAVVRKFQ